MSGYQPVNRDAGTEYFTYDHTKQARVVQAISSPPFSTQDGAPKTSWQACEGSFSRYWIWELLASTFSMGCIAAIVIVLLYEDGKRLDDWTLMISPNAVISFIAALAKSSCVLVLAEIIGQLRWIHFAHKAHKLDDLQVYDEASRGPYGAIKLILRSKMGASLASFASVLTIAALLIDPFAQLVLTFPSRAAPSLDRIASISVARAYAANTEQFTQAGGSGFESAEAQNAPFHLQSAIVSAAFGTDPPFDLSCPTSNCTFPPLSTMGVCSTCKNVSAISSTTCLNPANYDSYYPGSTCNTTVSLNPLSDVTYAMAFINRPNGSAALTSVAPVKFTWDHYYEEIGASGVAFNSSSLTVTAMGTPGEMTIPNAPFGHPAVFGAFVAMKIDAATMWGLTTSSWRPSQVNECMFSLCLKTYDGIAVRNGETIIGHTQSLPLPVSSRGYVDVIHNYTSRQYFTLSAPVNGTLTNFTMDYIDYLNIAQYMADIMNVGIIREGGSYSIVPGGSMLPSMGLAMMNSLNITTMMERIADSMTNSMRTSQANLTTIHGTAFVNETYIHINWKWLALPIIISVLSLILLVIVIVHSHRRGVEAWKSSSMPLLFYGLAGWGKAAMGFEDKDDLVTKAEDMRGKLLLDPKHRVFEREGLRSRTWTSL